MNYPVSQGAVTGAVRLFPADFSDEIGEKIRSVHGSVVSRPVVIVEEIGGMSRMFTVIAKATHTITARRFIQAWHSAVIFPGAQHLASWMISSCFSHDFDFYVDSSVLGSILKRVKTDVEPKDLASVYHAKQGFIFGGSKKTMKSYWIGLSSLFLTTFFFPKIIDHLLIYRSLINIAILLVLWYHLPWLAQTLFQL